MDNNKNIKRSGGIGVLGVLQIVFIVLKLSDVIDWSWFWVLSPIWLPILIIALVFILIFIIALSK